jgi:outer membrane protein TolC
MASLGAMAGGCARSPFSDAPDDYARRLAISRVKEIAPSDLASRAMASSADINREEAVIEAVKAARARFASLATTPLAIEDARKSALEHNLNLRVASFDPAIAAEVESEEAARWNSLFVISARYSDSRRSTGSRISSSEARSASVTPELRFPTRTGGTLSVPLELGYEETNNEFSELPEFYTVAPSVSYSQPLLRGAGRRVNTAQLRIAGYDARASQARRRLEVTRELAEVDRAYWRLYAARATLDVRLQQFELASAQLEKAQRRVREGQSPEVEVDRARAGLAQRLEGVVLAQNDILLRQRLLKRIINTPGLEMDTQVAVVPSTPPDPVEFAFDVATLQAGAIEHRAELLDLELQLASDAARILLARDDTNPRLDVNLRYLIQGVDAGLGDAIDDAIDRESRVGSIGIEGEVPLDNEAARSRLRRAILTRVQRIASRQAREQTVRQEVLDAADNITTGWQRILAARQAALAAGRQLQSEQRQFDLGRVTSTDVLDAASQLAEAQLTEVRALAEYQIAQVELALATGTLMGAAKVTLEDAPAADVRERDAEEP